VIWKENPDLHWASRWDIYMTMNNGIPVKVHWLNIIWNVVLTLALSACFLRMLIIILHRSNTALITEDSGNDDSAIKDDETVEESGWPAVRYNVFRPPSFSPMLLAVACGSGAQVLCTTIMTVSLACLGILNDYHKGAFVLCLLWSYTIFGCINGYVTARFYKTFDGTEQQRTTTLAAFGFSGIVFMLFLISNFIFMVLGSTYLVPLTVLLTLVLGWVGISVPLVFLGAYFGYRRDAVEYPVSTSSIPRAIPNQPWYRSGPSTVALSGILPVFFCYVELYYIMSSAWLQYYYVTFGFLLIVLWMVIVVVGEQAVLLTYNQLCHEDYHWWWRAFWNGGSVGIYVFLYSMIYFTGLEINSVSSALFYFGYMGLVSLAIFTMMGFVAVSSSLYFNIFLYTSIKAE
jgi:transmembrane 9 superfamily protein 2/4